MTTSACQPVVTSDILPIAPRRTVLAAWGLVALLNLSAGVVIAFQPSRQSDVDSMRRWGREWLAHGSSVYLAGGEMPDYPPNALVMLSPLGAVGDTWAVPVWAAFNLALALAAAYLAVRAFGPTTWSRAALPMLLFLCWGAFRTLMQFSLLAATLGLLSRVLADEQPIWSGICLGLAMMKPQMAAPFVLWALLARRLRVVGIAAGIALAGCVVFCVRAHANPFRLAIRYAEILRTYYFGNAILVGLSELRPLIARAVASTAAVDALTISVALVLLAVVCAIGLMEWTRTDRVIASAPPLAGVWALLAFYHLTYGFVLLLPAAALCLFVNDPRTRPLRTRAFWAMQIAMMIDVPGAWRRLEPLVGRHEIVGAAVDHADRVLMLALFACVVALARVRIFRTRTGEPIARSSA